MNLISAQHLFEGVEVLGFIIPSFFLTVISTTLSTAFVAEPYKVLKNMCLDFIVLVMPIILYCTVLEEYILLINIVLLVVMVLSIYLLQNRINAVQANAAGDCKTVTMGKILPYITNVRSLTNLITVICILAVDFFIFPFQFHKTANYGVSLMDVGVGLFVYGNGIVACEIRGVKHPIRKTFTNVLPILVVGALRFAATNLTHYHVNVKEYGVHWNFFITLAVTKLLSAAIMTCVRPSFAACACIGVCVVGVHQYALELGLENWVFSLAVQRDNLLAANREGIVSSLGYVGLYFLSVATGFTLQASKQKTRVFWTLTAGVVATCFATLGLHALFNISRCLANSTYVAWILLIGHIMTLLLFCYENFLNLAYAHLERVVYCPQMFECINYNGLTYFLVANLLTGAVNLCIDTLKVTDELSLIIISLYMFVNTSVVVFLYSKKIKLKL